ncbi:MAG: Hsp20/alpha crystallin family protein [Treponema sp.]|nr:Hsp20/alpha crystallin family protein [Treponema sp.]
MNAVSFYRPVSIGKTLNDFDRYLDSFFDSSLSSSDSRIRGDIPAVDVRETDAGYFLEAELPGFDEKNIQVHVDGGNLTIESRKEEETKKEEKKDGNYLIRERRRMSFSRSFKLPENANTEQVSAVFKNGVLSLEIKKRAESQKRLVKIEAK